MQPWKPPSTDAAVVRYQVTDLDRATDFYTSRLGFALEQRAGPVAIVSRGALHLILSAPDSSGSRRLPGGQTQQPGGSNRIVLYVDDLDEVVGQSARRRARRSSTTSCPGPAASRCRSAIPTAIRSNCTKRPDGSVAAVGNVEPACAGRHDRHVGPCPHQIQLLADDRRLGGAAQLVAGIRGSRAGSRRCRGAGRAGPGSGPARGRRRTPRPPPRRGPARAAARRRRAGSVASSPTVRRREASRRVRSRAAGGRTPHRIALRGRRFHRRASRRQWPGCRGRCC